MFFRVKKNSNLQGKFSKNFLVSLEMWDEWLSSTILFFSAYSYLESNKDKKTMKSKLLFDSRTKAITFSVDLIVTFKKMKPSRAFYTHNYDQQNHISRFLKRSENFVCDSCMPWFSSYETLTILLFLSPFIIRSFSLWTMMISFIFPLKFRITSLKVISYPVGF